MQYLLIQKPSERPALSVRSLLLEHGCQRASAYSRYLPKRKVKVETVKPAKPAVVRAVVDVRDGTDLPMFETDYVI